MASKQVLEREISNTEDMSSIVRTMKSLAAVNVRTFGQARRSIEQQVDVLERGFQVALSQSPSGWPSVGQFGQQRTDNGRSLAIVFGSVQGMCGQFNDHLADHVADRVANREKQTHIVANGERIAGALNSRGLSPEVTLPAASSLDAITDQVYSLLGRIQSFRASGGSAVHLFYNHVSSQTSYDPRLRQILPLDDVWLTILHGQRWPGRVIPLSLASVPHLMEELVRRFLYAELSRAALESLTSENGARLSSMQAAEKNIDERLDELHQEHNRRRQSEITEELLDIVGGYTVLSAE